MSDDDLTPPAGLPPGVAAAAQVRRELGERIGRLEAELSETSARAEQAERRLIALVGEDGTNGKMSVLRAALGELRHRVEKNEERSIKNDREIGMVALKLGLIVVAAGAIGTLIANAVLGKIHFGG